MNRSSRLMTVVAVGLTLLFTSGCNKLRARDQLNKGVQSYKNARYEEAISRFQQAVSLDPGLLNARLYLATAFAQQYIPGADTEERAKLGLKPEEPLKDKKVCHALKDKNSPFIQDGIDDLNKAIQLRPDYDDAMAYLNLLYREKADLECDDPVARAADLKTADEWVDKTMAVKKARAEKQPGAQGITMQPNQ